LDGEKVDRIKSLNQSETEVFEEILKDPSITVTKLSDMFVREPGSIRTNLTSIYKKLRVPEDVEYKRDWVVKEYAEAYEYILRGGEPEIYIAPPDPIPVEVQEPLSHSEAQSPPQPQPASPIVIPQPQMRPDQTTMIFISVLLVIAIIIIVIMGSQISQMKKAPVMLVEAPILFYDAFGLTVPLQSVPSGSYAVTNGYLTTPGGVGFTFGNNNWENYMIFTSIVTYGCDPSEAGTRGSFIGVRNNTQRNYIAYSWKACESQTSGTKNIMIKVSGNQITSSINGIDQAPIFISEPGYEKGGMVIGLDKESAIDYLLVVGLP